MDKDKLIELVQELEKLRGGVPSYVLFDDIRPLAYRRVFTRLQKVERGEEVDIILNSPGGSADEAYRMIRAFRKKYVKVNVVVPFWAKSAATLFAFGATNLVLADGGELGPIDAQIRRDDEKSPDGEWSSALNVSASVGQIEKRSREEIMTMFEKIRSSKESEIIKIGRKHLAEMLFEYGSKFYAPLLQKIDPLEMGQMARTLDVGRMYARRILKQYTETSDEKINDLLDFLVYECLDHGYVVDYDAIRLFLDFVARTSDEPFGKEYDKTVAQLTLALMVPDVPVLNDFAASFTVKQSSDTIQGDEKNNVGKSEREGTSSGGFGSGSRKDENKALAPATKPDIPRQ